MKNLVKKVMIVAPLAFLAQGAFLFAKEPFASLTSNSKASENQSSIPFASNMPSEVNVHSLGIGMGQTALTGDFRKIADDNVALDILYNYSASHSFDLYANAHYSSHEYLKERVKLPGINAGIKAKFYQFDSFSPFLLGGFGFYRPEVRRVINGQLLDARTKVTFGYNLGAGAELLLNRNFAFGVLGHYHNPFDIRQEAGPEIEGSYFKILLTGLYRF